MKIDTETHLTIEQAMAAIGCTRRSLYRAIDRAKADGIVTTCRVISTMGGWPVPGVRGWRSGGILIRSRG